MTLCRALVGLGATGLLLAAVALVPQPTAASWSVAPTLSSTVGTLAACSTSSTFNGQAEAQTLAGTMLGTSVGGLSQTTPVSVSATSSGTTVSSGATNRGGGLYSTSSGLAAVASTLNSAAGRTILTTASGSTWSATAQGATTGISSASAGSVTPSSGALTTSGGSSLGTLDVSAALRSGSSALTGLTGVTLTAGPAGASVSLDGCRQVWAIGTPLTRAYHVGSLTLQFADAAAGTLDTAIATQNASVTAAFATATGSGTANTIAAVVGADLATAVRHGLANLVTSPGATINSTSVTVTLPAAARATLAADLSEVVADASAIASLNTGTGISTIDASVLMGGSLDGLGANTAVLGATNMHTLVSALQSALDAHIAAVERDWAAARDAMTVEAQASVTGTTTSGSSVATATVDVTAPLATWAAWAAGTGTAPQPAPTVTAGSVLSTLGLNLSTVTTAMSNAMPADFYSGNGGVPASIAANVTTPDANAVASAVSNVTSARSTEVGALSGEVGSLASVLALTLNQQADGAPQLIAYAGALPTSVTALHIVVTGSSGAVVDLDLANASVGPNWSYGRS